MPEVGAIDRRTGEVQGVRAARLRQENLVRPGSHAGLGPLGQTAPAGHARAEAELLRQVSPGDSGVRHEQDALEHQPVRTPRASGMQGSPITPSLIP